MTQTASRRAAQRQRSTPPAGGGAAAAPPPGAAGAGLEPRACRVHVSPPRAPWPPTPCLQARFANATGPNWVAAWAACIAWQFAFVQQTPGGMWLAFALILTAFLAMGRAMVQLYG